MKTLSNEEIESHLCRGVPLVSDEGIRGEIKLEKPILVALGNEVVLVNIPELLQKYLVFNAQR